MNSFVRFTEILLGNGGIQRILNAIHEELGTAVAWKEARTGTVVCSGDRYFCERASTYPLKELMRLYDFREVRASRQLAGHLLLNVPSGNTRENAERVENGVSAIRLFYGQKIARDKLESGYRDNFVRDLLYNKIAHPEELANRARAFHWQLDGGVVCVIATFTTESGGKAEQEISDDFWELIRVRIRAFFPQSVFSQEARSIIFLLSLGPQAGDPRQFNLRLNEVWETLCRDLRERYSVEALIAAGGYRDSPLLAHASYQEARQALRILENSPRERNFVFWDNLGGDRLIATLADSEAARDFCKSTLAPLIGDESKNGELLKTLLCIEENNGNMRNVAQKLSMHYNTVKYRAGRIWEILGIDPENADERFNLSLAIRIYKILGSTLV